ncbi:nuclear distribution protein nudE-like 1-A isoform X2 [Sycon ciliatum]|uniref:nuclear distribution protein nudE-like 1-A isoform X2 n=1 Tax=Sycon ciliatum TaxID=27933 RepID=UPI0031F62C71
MASVGDEATVEYWKNRAEDFEEKLLANQVEFEEYQESSAALEAELEAQLQLDEKKISDLQGRNVRFEQDNHNLQDKLECLNRKSQQHIEQLECEVQRLSVQCQTVQNYTRELEQTNDDLDRAQRATVQSLTDFEVRLNAALERNALLEGELDEKEDLLVMVQRLKDESRDMQQELFIRAQTSRSSFVTPMMMFNERCADSSVGIGGLRGNMAATGASPMTSHRSSSDFPAAITSNGLRTASPHSRAIKSRSVGAYLPTALSNGGDVCGISNLGLQADSTYGSGDITRSVSCVQEETGGDEQKHFPPDNQRQQHDTNHHQRQQQNFHHHAQTQTQQPQPQQQPRLPHTPRRQSDQSIRLGPEPITPQTDDMGAPQHFSYGAVDVSPTHDIFRARRSQDKGNDDDDECDSLEASQQSAIATTPLHPKAQRRTSRSSSISHRKRKHSSGCLSFLCCPLGSSQPSP